MNMLSSANALLAYVPRAAARRPIGPMSAAERARGRYMRDGEGHGTANPAFKAILDQHLAAIEQKFGGLGIEDLKARLAHMEQAATRPGGGTRVKSYGQQVADSEQFKQLQANSYHGHARIELKAITTASGSGGGLNWSDRDTDVEGMARRAYRVRDLLRVVATTSTSIDYAKQTTRTNAAAPVAEGSSKPYSNFGWTKATVQVRTVAHLAKLTRQAMDDATQLAGEVDAEMRYGLDLVEDSQLLFGDGTGENLTGLYPAATAYSAPSGFVAPPGNNRIDQLAAAILQQLLTDFPADGIVLHPTDWMQIRLLKDANGNYLFGKPGTPVDPVLFGLPVAETAAMTVGSYLVGGFKRQKLYDRMGTEVLISSENADDFEKNLLTMRAEKRLALAIRQAAAMVRGTFA